MNNERILKKDIISVIIPVYNTKKYLNECVKSVIGQSYKQLEIIIVDDGSTDGSGDLCDSCLKLDSRIKVFHKQNEGLGFTRNYGIMNAMGEYLFFLDSDDKIASDFLEELINYTKSNNADICKAGFTRFYNSKIIKKTCYSNCIYKGKEVIDKFLPRLVGSLPDRHDSVEMAACATLYKTKIIIDNNILFPSERELISEDLIFNIEYFQYAKVGCLISSAGYYYRINYSSLTRSYRDGRFEACKKFYKYMEELLIKLGYKREVILRLDRVFFINIRSCLRQERFNPDSDKVVGNIKKICSDLMVQNIISEYPCNKLGLKQRLFLKLIKNKNIMIIRIMLYLKFI